MEGLRRRISNLFLAFMETPEFNPEAGRFTVAPPDRIEMMRSSLGTPSAPALQPSAPLASNLPLFSLPPAAATTLLPGWRTARKPATNTGRNSTTVTATASVEQMAV